MKLKGLLTAAIAVFAVCVAMAQSERQVNHTFNVKNGGHLKLSNSFGDMKIESYGGDIIDVNVTIILELKNDKNKEELFDKVKIEATESGNRVSVRTVNDLNGGRDVKKFEINYYVKVPEGLDVEVHNSFGHVTVNGVVGNMEVDVQHGDCYIAKAGSGRNNLRVSFGDLRVKEIGEVDVKVQHGDAHLGSVGPIEGKFQFGDGSIDVLKGDARISVAHGDFDIDNMNASLVNLIHIDAQFSDVSVGGVDGEEFLLEMEGSFSDFDFDDSWFIRTKEKDYNREEYMIFTKGERAGPKTIQIIGSHSDVNVR